MGDATKEAIVHINEDGEVESVTVDDALLTFSIKKINIRNEIPKTVIREYCPKMSDQLKQSVKFGAPPRALAVIPWSGAVVRPGTQYSDITTYVLPAEKTPEAETFFPMQWRYASGIMIVEIEPTLDKDRTIAVTEEYLIRKDFSAILESLSTSMRGSNKPQDIPGFILQDTVNFLKPYASKSLIKDTLLSTYNPDFIKKCRLKLQPSDYIGFFKSDWADSSIETRKLDGHKEAQAHYYAVVKYTLPAECVDQLKHILFANPSNDTWVKLVNRKIFARASEISKAVRHKFLMDTLSAVGLQPRKSNPAVVDTEFDFFEQQTVTVGSTEGNEDVGVVFHSGCTSTARAERGMCVEIGPERDSGLIWLHGSASPVVGGSAWKQPASVNSLPVLATSKITKKTLDQFANAGWGKQNGYVKLVPISFI